MDVLVEIRRSIPVSRGFRGIPALDTESARPKVTVADGGTVVIGGIIISSQRTDIQQVPLVGQLGRSLGTCLSAQRDHKVAGTDVLPDSADHSGNNSGIYFQLRTETRRLWSPRFIYEDCFEPTTQKPGRQFSDVKGRRAGNYQSSQLVYLTVNGRLWHPDRVRKGFYFRHRWPLSWCKAGGK